ncbi:MAG: CU044_2847 family protein [Leptolyngbyaceae cyanobacterium MO_188.B28]|nr:CU044_2847 family protein [Leptolyngbyaceae cyanobacterium MO_188.B28]
MPRFRLDEDAPILVEFTPQSQTDSTATLMRTDLEERSADAIHHAMNTLRNMAQQVVETLNTLDNQPDQVEVEFGLKLNWEGQAAIAHSSDRANFKVKMIWSQPSESPDWIEDDTYTDNRGGYRYDDYDYEEDEEWR